MNTFFFVNSNFILLKIDISLSDDECHFTMLQDFVKSSYSFNKALELDPKNEELQKAFWYWLLSTILVHLMAYKKYLNIWVFVYKPFFFFLILNYDQIKEYIYIYIYICMYVWKFCGEHGAPSNHILSSASVIQHIVLLSLHWLENWNSDLPLKRRFVNCKWICN